MPAPSDKPVETWKTVAVILLLLFFYPIGLIFMFVWMKWPMWVKGILTGFFIIWVPIIAMLSAVVVMTINPLELTKRARDAARLTDLANIQEMMNTAALQSPSSNWLCNGQPKYCEGISTAALSNKSDGTGWVKVNFDEMGIRLPVPNSGVQSNGFPVDPVNSNVFYYRYCSNGKNWEIDVKLESEKMVNKMATDEGDNNSLYEIGSNLNLCK